MPRYVQLTRPRTRPHVARSVPRVVTVHRDIFRLAAPTLDVPFAALPSSIAPELGPHVDYARRLTSEGGVLVTYKDLDLRLRHIIARFLAWTAFTGLEAWFLIDQSPVESEWVNRACLLVIAAINFLILWKMPEIYRSVEIRPDCMVLDGADVFSLGLMESLPAFDPDENDNLILSGSYGTRHVEYLTARRFDKHDRMPEVFAAHLKEAMQQLWELLKVQEPRHGGSPPWQRR
jgi:hypothetical protein